MRDVKSLQSDRSDFVCVILCWLGVGLVHWCSGSGPREADVSELGEEQMPADHFDELQDG